MASVSSVGSSGSIYGQRNVLSGLASGMDTESMIENMTQATRLKIAQQKQKKELLGWKQSAYQSISSPLIEFSKKYCDYSSSTNLLSSAFFDQSTTSAVGKNNMYVSASGKTNSKVELLGVEQLASAATHTVKGFSGSTSIQSGAAFGVGPNDFQETSKLNGGSFTFTYGSKDYTITLDASDDYQDPQKLAEALNKKLSEVSVSVSGDSSAAVKLGDKIEFSVGENYDGQKVLRINTKGNDAGNTIKLTSVSANVKDVLGFDPGKDGQDVKGGISSKGFTIDDLKHKVLNRDLLAGKKIQISLNGESKTITMPELVPKKDASGNVIKDSDGNVVYEDWNEADFMKHLESQVKQAFGDKVVVEDTQKGSGIQLAFRLGGAANDKNDVLRINGGDSQALGVLGMKTGDGNRINMNKTMGELGFMSGDQATLKINGTSITVKKDMTMRELMDAINSNEDMGVTMTYSELSDTMQLTAKDTGAGHDIKIEGVLGKKLFGSGVAAAGKDAHISVKVNGDIMELTRSSNEINIDGLKLNISGTFGEYKDGKVVEKADETVTFETKTDTDKIFDAIKSMVEDYNKIMDTVYKEMTTKPNKDYQPLTDEQREEMSESQIEKWEEKAKEGLLYGDTQLRGLHSALRFIFNPGGEATQKLRAMGISVNDSLDPAEGGKVTLDESKLRAALESDPEGVRDAFNALPQDGSSSNPNDDIMNSARRGGVMTRLDGVIDQYASTSLVTPGILVARAGSPHSANSLLKNTLKTEMDRIDDVLSSLNDKLSTEIDRYNSQFTQLEMMISQMNAQSAQLSGLLGG